MADDATTDTPPKAVRLSREEARRYLTPWIRGIAALMAFLVVVLCVVIGASPATTVLLLVAGAGLAVGAAAGLVLGAVESEWSRFSGVFAAANGALGGAALVDLLRTGGILRAALKDAAVHCGLAGSGSIVAVTFAAFAAAGFLAAYQVKKLWFNPPQRDEDGRIQQVVAPVPPKGGGGGATTPPAPGGPPAQPAPPAPPAGAPAGGPVSVASAGAAAAPPAPGVGGGVASVASSASAAIPPAPPNDPQKHQWGGKPERDHRKLDAVVTPDPGDPDWFDIRLEVTSTDLSRPLTGMVRFHVHDSFPQTTYAVKVRDGRAVLELGAYGAFTVGAEVLSDGTRLELDLADLPHAPPVFRSR